MNLQLEMRRMVAEEIIWPTQIKTNKSSVQDVNRTQAAGVRVKCPISELLCPTVYCHREAKERSRNQQSPSLC